MTINVLVLDDDDEIFYSKELSFLKQWNLIQFSNASDFLLHVGSTQFDETKTIALIDIDLGGPDAEEGLNIFEHLVNQKIYIPAIIVSSSNISRLRERAANIGSYDYISKDDLLDDSGVQHLRAAITRAIGSLEFRRSYNDAPGQRAILVALSLEHEIGNGLQPITNKLLSLSNEIDHLEEANVVAKKSDVQLLVSDVQKLIDDLNELVEEMCSVIRTGRTNITGSRIDLSIETQKILSKLYKDLDFFDDFSDSATATITSKHFQQIVVNIVDNAIKHKEGDAIIRVYVQNTSNTVEFGVESPGTPLINKQKIESLFIPGIKDIGAQRQGRGMGLAIVKLLAEMHGGEVFHVPVVTNSDSQTSDGNIFGIRLPKPETN